jgi:hypothetical protein
MACPTCDGTMEFIDTNKWFQRTFWCHRCGTIKTVDANGYNNISLPSWIRRNATKINGQYVLKDSRFLDEVSKHVT